MLIEIEGATYMPTTPANKFYLTESQKHDLESKSLDGDSAAAVRLAQYYNLYLTSEIDSMYGDVWTYISGLLGNEIAKENLGKILKQKKITGIREMFLQFSHEIGKLKNSNTIISNFILYNYYVFKGDDTITDIYLKYLKNAKVDPRLYTNVK